jgi:hypothetical protein
MDEQLDKVTNYMVTFIVTIFTYLIALILGPIFLLLNWFVRSISKYYHTYNRVNMDDMPNMFPRTS